MATRTVVICGVGYVGLHLVETFSKRFRVIAFDVSEARCELLRKQFAGSPRVVVTSKPDDMTGFDLCCISVPTLLKKGNDGIDASYVEKAVEIVGRYAAPNSTVVMESSVTVGMTRDFLAPLRDKQVFVGFSPERVDPGRTVPSCDQIPKVISGIDQASLDSVKSYYERVFDMVVPVATMETAEMSKLYENCFRMINIAYANEIADQCMKHGIDPYEMIRACSTKPFGFMPFHPGLGVGGHCIPVNPWYLFTNNDLPLLRAATEATAQRPIDKANLLIEELHPESVLIVGVAFKPGQSVMSYAPQVSFANALKEKGVRVAYYDPLVPQASCPDIPKLETTDFNEEYLDKNFTVIAVAMKQDKVDFVTLEMLQKAHVYWYCHY
ncbi:hypothetical protein HDU87_007303 [Geranomyces variabilis]|uniref:UDP-glucose/GDP-mannose dehydrogenase C-terminal domain-containing protein n=1 Tax=Geranomyces variabilis TaxID=109894 RepID=A0AAD5TGG3_9FUNG|nr:hypothetical protein HDU87_007303 [Geranomyces variabilis]